MKNKRAKERSRLAKVARETLAITISGKYQDHKGVDHVIGDEVEWAVECSELFSPEDLQDTRGMLEGLPFAATTRTEVVNESSISAAYRLLEDHPGEEVTVLNFASGSHPGGGFLRGAQAQEECLARASALYSTLTIHPKMYEHNNREEGSRLYSDYMIFSPQVPTFRNEYELLVPAQEVNYLTVPAVNRGRLDEETEKLADETMISRMEKLLSVLAARHQEYLVLGAWGCGVYGNSCEDVAGWFHDFLNEQFDGAFQRIVFAILDTSEEEKFIGPFKNQFE